ncbi:MAG TPA: FliI/YscN family ATPase [Candidatus Saccharimonadales bacterium]|nr:FliI/YscN family ATPase [Candidatus Saccharimonadales bacterium]
MILDSYHQALQQIPQRVWSGRISKAIAGLIESEGPHCALGDCCLIRDHDGNKFEGEVVGFHGSTVLSMPLYPAKGVRHGDTISTWGARPSIRVTDDMVGRVLDASGRAMDGGAPLNGGMAMPVVRVAPNPFEREPIQSPIGTGVRAIDAFLTCGRGQRVGIFGGSGVGKSTLMGMMARGTSADLTVVALVGERGREVREVLENALGEAGRRRSIVVVSTSDQSPLLRLRAAQSAHSIAEYFAARGKHVLLVLDSITRFAMAQREIGLAAGEPPTAKGYTPSVFTLLSQLVERAGNFRKGSITAFYTVLMEGDDQMDPVVDAVRSLLDGHILLDRRLTSEGHFPPIQLLESLSRLMPAVCSGEHLSKAQRLRHMLASYTRSEDLIRIGAYQRGSDPDLDRAMQVVPNLRAFARQGPAESSQLERTIESLLTMEE